jgi:deazaflavin-dependent oxidoreductase (nitroreductase family)
MALREFKKALKTTNEIELTVTGRTSGRKISRPVWFVEDGETLYLLPVKGSDSEWYKNVLENPRITLAAAGVTWNATAVPITDVAEAHDVVEKFRARYGRDEVKKYYSKFDVAVRVPLTSARKKKASGRASPASRAR